MPYSTTLLVDGLERCGAGSVIALRQGGRLANACLRGKQCRQKGRKSHWHTEQPGSRRTEAAEKGLGESDRRGTCPRRSNWRPRASADALCTSRGRRAPSTVEGAETSATKS